MRLRRLSALLIALLSLSPLALATVPAGYVQITGSNLVDTTGTKVVNATIYFAPVSTLGTAISYRIGGIGQAIQSPVSALVTNGAFTIQVADTSQTSPLNVCYAVTVIDNVSGNSILGPGYSCVQPATSGLAITSQLQGVAAWCTPGTGGTGGTCNFDNFPPNEFSLLTSQPWPTSALSIGTVLPGTAGVNPTVSISGTAPTQVLNFTLEPGNNGAAGPAPNLTGVNVTEGSSLGGSWSGCPNACVLSLVITAGLNYRGAFMASTTYNSGDIVLYSGNLYVAPAPFVSGASFNSANWNAYPGGGSSAPGGPPASMQYNAGGALNGTAYATLDNLGNGTFASLNMVGSGTHQITSTGTITGADFAMGAKSTLALVGVGDSRMAGSTMLASLGVTTGLPNAGALGNQDIISRLAQQPQYLNRAAYVANLARGGAACSTMTSDYTALNVARWAPGAANAPNATQTDLYIGTGENDAYSAGGSTLAQYQNCMGAYLETVTAAGFSPILITSYMTGADSATINQLMQSYNFWEITLDGKVMNGKTIRTIDVEAAIPPNLGNSPYYVGYPANAANTKYPITSYSITNSGSVSTIIFTTSQTTANTAFLTANPAMELGLFNSPSSNTYLNYQKATYVSGAGTQTITATLAIPFPATSGTITVTDSGSAWSWNPAMSTFPAGKHVSPDFTDFLAKYINAKLQISELGTVETEGHLQDNFTPPSGEEIISGGLILSGTPNTPTNGLGGNQGVVNPGNLAIGSTWENSAPGIAGFRGGAGIINIGGKDEGMQVTATGANLFFPTYSGPSGAVGAFNVNNGGNGLAVVGDTVVVTGGGSGTATGLVTAVSSTTGCTIQPGCVGVITQIAPPANATAAGTGYSLANYTASDTTTSGVTGLSIGTLPGADVALKISAPGVAVNGGALKASAYGLTPYSPDRTGELASAVSGAVVNATVVNGASATGCYVTGDTIAANFGFSATVTASACTVTALTVVTGGYNYIGGATNLASSGGSGTGLTWAVSGVTTPVTGRVRFGSNYYIYEFGAGVTWLASGKLTLNQAFTASGQITGPSFYLPGSTSGGATLSSSATGGTLNLGSTNASVTSGGALSVTSCSGCQNGGAVAGDLSGNASNPTVVQVNNGAVPLSSPVVGTNSLGQVVAAGGSAIQTAIGTLTIPVAANSVSGCALWRDQVNILNCGGMADGTTDNSAALANAITAAGSGGVVFFPCGEFKFTTILNSAPASRSVLYLPSLSHITFAGEGHCSHLFTSLANTTIFEVAGTDVNFKNLNLSPVLRTGTFTENYQNDGGAAIRLSGVTGSTLENVEMSGGNTATLWISNGSSKVRVDKLNAHDGHAAIWIDNCQAGNSSSGCGTSTPPSDIDIDGFTIAGMGQGSDTNPAIVIDAGNNNISTRIVKGTITGTSYTGGGRACIQNNDSSGVTIALNTLNNCGQDGITMTANTGDVMVADAILDNTITGGAAEAGITIYAGGTGVIKSPEVNGNNISNVGGYGIKVYSFTNSAQIVAASYGVDTISNADQTSSGNADGMLLEGAGLNVSGITINADTALPAHRYGININPLSVNVQGAGNTIAGSLAAALYDSGAVSQIGYNNTFTSPTINGTMNFSGTTSLNNILSANWSMSGLGVLTAKGFVCSAASASSACGVLVPFDNLSSTKLFYWARYGGGYGGWLDSQGSLYLPHVDQVATNSFAGSCSMSSGTSCTWTLASFAFTSTPLGFASPQSSYAGGSASCSVSGTTVTITAPTSNSLTWNCMLVGNPN